MCKRARKCQAAIDREDARRTVEKQYLCHWSVRRRGRSACVFTASNVDTICLDAEVTPCHSLLCTWLNPIARTGRSTDDAGGRMAAGSRASEARVISMGYDDV